ncbi:MAG: hypothetical protein HKN10_13050 [Myxococcales bacterium]|nr:hypothetical protein [Deltaproteobacteria bacterium]NNE19396.1 hypothetical protein [Myxococcales bacterium]
MLWPIFGASNQLLAALTLMTLSLYFLARKRPLWPRYSGWDAPSSS